MTRVNTLELNVWMDLISTIPYIHVYIDKGLCCAKVRLAKACPNILRCLKGD